MISTFENCKALKTLDLSSFDTSKVSNMKQLFDGCVSLRKVVLSKKWQWLAYNMDSMFFGCKNLIDIDFSNFPEGKYINLHRTCMFGGDCKPALIKKFKKEAH